MSIWWSLHLRREAASVPLARRLLVGTMETAGVHPETSFELSVALSEACANAVAYGGEAAADPADGRYRVTAYLDGEKCRIEVADSGPGFPAARAGSAGSAGSAGRRRSRAGRPENEQSPPSAGHAGHTGPTDRLGWAGPAAHRTGRREHIGHRERPERPEHAEHAEHGRGLLLIASLADHVHVRNRPGRGAVVCFSKMLKWQDGARVTGGPLAGPVLSP
ncbi:ATP-binding protein [Streptomyces sp. F63]|uniref:ATP-binding protein n=1 Tax=Streptomyces sp. F63 TaxID=2824887 RepID=UPI001B39AE9F|nr:ATP-binding protein [Streptomyces sp. F63]MBQ0983328.1 ATP-binding protein [Streptomyces sp. F63]